MPRILAFEAYGRDAHVEIEPFAAQPPEGGGCHHGRRRRDLRRPRQAAAQWWCFWCGGETGGGTGGGTSGGTTTCFLRGTRIRTADGYRPIEQLAVGDHVAARFAGVAPIKCIESFTLERAGPRREWRGHSRPVTVRCGALGEGAPHRDLCLTAAHAVFVDGFLMPVGQLVNGTSIVFEAAEGHDSLDFFHVELERHDVPLPKAHPANRGSSRSPRRVCPC